MLRLKNIHPELNGMDMSSLFSTVAPVDFVKFDPRNETIAYVCFQLNFAENNHKAIQKFDGKKAMGNTLVAESATSLADRIAPASFGPRRERVPSRQEAAPRPREQHRVTVKAKVTAERAKKVRPVKKTAEDLDNELAAYMNAASAAAEPAAVKAALFASQNNGEVMMD